MQQCSTYCRRAKQAAGPKEAVNAVTDPDVEIPSDRTDKSEAQQSGAAEVPSEVEGLAMRREGEEEAEEAAEASSFAVEAQRSSEGKPSLSAETRAS